MIHPRIFIAEYVQPAHELLRNNVASKHLAVHAIAQVDILAEVTALWLHTNGLDAEGRFVARRFRDSLGERHPVLAMVRDAHDSHKHGVLDLQTRAISKGQRPEVTTKMGFVIGRSALGGRLHRYKIVTLTDNAGNEIGVHHLLSEALEAWELELATQGL